MLKDLGRIFLEKMREIRDEGGGKLSFQHLDAVVHGLLTSIKGYVLSQEDLVVYQEIESLLKQIKHAKTEVASVEGHGLTDQRIPDAAAQLRSVTMAAESSTNSILDLVEKIQSEVMTMENSDAKTKILGHITEIFEACNFQDITGQRISKVLGTLDDIESRVGNLIDAFINKKEGGAALEVTKPAASAKASAKAKEKVEAKKVEVKKPAASEEINIEDEKKLLNGPQLEAPSQNDIDDIFDTAPSLAEVKKEAAGQGKSQSQQDIDDLFN
jgi:chemotaxis protein CheZ